MADNKQWYNKQPTGNGPKPSGKRPEGNKTARKRPVGKKPAGKMPVAQKPVAGQKMQRKHSVKPVQKNTAGSAAAHHGKKASVKKAGNNAPVAKPKTDPKILKERKKAAKARKLAEENERKLRKEQAKIISRSKCINSEPCVRMQLRCTSSSWSRMNLTDRPSR